MGQEEETLRQLGLSPMQSRVYLTLIQLGKSSAKSLAKQTSVARPDIYRIMVHFEQLGLCQKILTTPIMFEATPIEQAIPILMEQKAEETQRLRKRTEELISELKPKQHIKAKGETDSDLLMLPATRASLTRRIELIQNAQQSIDVICSWKHYKSLLDSNINELTKQAVARGVKYRIIIESPTKIMFTKEHQEAIGILKKNNSVFKYLNQNPSTIISIYDKKEALIALSEKGGPSNVPMLWSNNYSMVTLATGYFENQWKLASENPP